MSESPASPAFEAEVAERKEVKPTFELFGQTWTIERRPNPLLLAEVSRAMQSGNFSDLGSLVDLFERILGAEQYRRFRDEFLDSDIAEEPDSMVQIMSILLSAAAARPTE